MVGVVHPPLGWAVVGCGWVARDYVIPGILASANGRLMALCDPDPAALDAVDADVPRFSDLDAALRVPGVEAVYVATPNHLHEAQVRAAAAAAKHVLCEKPMAPTAAAARRMILACEAAGVRYATAFDQRFHAAHRTLKRLVAEGALGVVAQARVHYACWVGADWTADNWRIDPARAGGGAAIDLAPHGLDLLQHVLGSPVVAVRAMLQRRVHSYPVDDGGALIARLADGTLATLNVAYNCPETYPRRRLELIGTKAMAVAHDTMGQTPGGRLRLIDAASGEARDVPLDDDRGPFMVQVEAFAAAVRHDLPFIGGEPIRDVALAELLERALIEGTDDG